MKKPNRNSATRKVALSVLAALTLAGAGAYAGFSDTETANRDVDAGQLDIMVSPVELSVQDMAPGDHFARAMIVDIPDANNDGDLIEYLSVHNTPGGDWANPDPDPAPCGDVNEPFVGGGTLPYECDDPGAHLLDGNALVHSYLACPNNGQVSDANPTVDDDGDPATDARNDGPGPHTCSTGDFYMTNQAMPLTTWSGGGFFPGAVGAQEVVHEGTPAWEDPGDPNIPDLVTFADGQTIEFVVCIAMPNDINEDGLPDNDYENLTASIDFNWVAEQRYGAVAHEPVKTHQQATMESYVTEVSGCEEATGVHPPEPLPEGTLGGFFFYDGGQDGQYGSGDFGVDGYIDLYIWDEGSQDWLPYRDIEVGWGENYLIPHLDDGDYRAWASASSSGYQFSPPNVGDDATDSDFEQVPGEPYAEFFFTIEDGSHTEAWLGMFSSA